MTEKPGTERAAEIPKFERIAAELRAAIAAGDYRHGDRLPGENVLAPQHNVAVMTIRQAVGVLKGEGLVESRKGAGVFVTNFAPIRRRGIPRLARQQWGAGQSIWAADDNRALDVDQVSVDEVVPPDHIGPVLGLSEGQTACARSRRYVIDGRPVMLATSYLPFELVSGSAIIQADTGPGGLYARLRDLGHGPEHFREEIRSRPPTSVEVARLRTSAERPVLIICRTAYAEGGRAVEVNEMTLDAASYVLEYEFDA